MNDGGIHQISEKIGGLQRSVEIMTDMWKSQEASASAGRRALHDKLENFKDEVRLQMNGFSLRIDRVVDQVKAMGEQMKEIEPAIKAYREEKLRDEGARRQGKRWWGWIVIAAGATSFAISEALHWIRP